MCTATWRATPDGYELRFNRDELRTRKAAIPPALQKNGTTPFIAPIDADAGGTWIAVNQHGVSFFLLNYYLAESHHDPGNELTSRGSIIPTVATARSKQEAVDAVGTLDLSPFLAFTFGAIDRLSQSAMLIVWDGERRIDNHPVPPLSSSSYRSYEVIQNRIDLFSERTLSGDEYHRSHLPEKGPFSVCMHRPDARTVSYSRISVSATEAMFEYAPGNPCETDVDADPIVLPLA